MRRLGILFVFIACFAGGARAAGGVREALEGSIAFSSSDSIESLTRFSASRLGVEMYDSDAGKKHNEWTELTPEAMQRVLEAASIEGMPVRVADAGEEPPANTEPSAPSPSVSATPEPPRVRHHHVAHVAPLPAEPTDIVQEKDANSNQNRLVYVGYQTLLSTYVYGLALPLAFGVTNPRFLIASPLLVAPAALGIHYWLSSDLDFSESHLKGTLYMSSLAEYAATALPMAFAGNFRDGYRGSALLGVAAYPLGVWYGYHLGDVYRSNPDELDTKFQFALGYAFFGFITPTLYFEHPGDHNDDVLRLGLGQSVGMAVLGHFVADYYQTGSGVSSGVPLGIATHVLLGGLAGVEVASIADASKARPWLGAALFGTSLGFTEGVFFFHSSQDDFDRSRLALVGTLGGAMMGTGIELLLFNSKASAHEQKIAWSSFAVGGAWLGYWTTYALTSAMTEVVSPRAQVQGSSGAPKWAFNPLPMLAPVQSRGEWTTRWQIPGFSTHF
jgi:hypothetical protein